MLHLVWVKVWWHLIWGYRKLDVLLNKVHIVDRWVCNITKYQSDVTYSIRWLRLNLNLSFLFYGILWSLMIRRRLYHRLLLRRFYCLIYRYCSWSLLLLSLYLWIAGLIFRAILIILSLAYGIIISWLSLWILSQIRYDLLWDAGKVSLSLILNRLSKWLTTWRLS